MPNGVTKKIFKGFIKYYDSEIFVATGKRFVTLPEVMIPSANGASIENHSFVFLL